MVFVRKLVSICLQHSVNAKHIPGVRNQLADALSRLQVQTFRHLAPPHMDSLPTAIPLSAASELGSTIAMFAKSSF